MKPITQIKIELSQVGDFENIFTERYHKATDIFLETPLTKSLEGLTAVDCQGDNGLRLKISDIFIAYYSLRFQDQDPILSQDLIDAISRLHDYYNKSDRNDPIIDNFFDIFSTTLEENNSCKEGPLYQSFIADIRESLQAYMSKYGAERVKLIGPRIDDVVFFDKQNQDDGLVGHHDALIPLHKNNIKMIKHVRRLADEFVASLEVKDEGLQKLLLKEVGTMMMGNVHKSFDTIEKNAIPTYYQNAEINIRSLISSIKVFDHESLNSLSKMFDSTSILSSLDKNVFIPHDELNDFFEAIEFLKTNLAEGFITNSVDFEVYVKENVVHKALQDKLCEIYKKIKNELCVKLIKDLDLKNGDKTDAITLEKWENLKQKSFQLFEEVYANINMTLKGLGIKTLDKNIIGWENLKTLSLYEMISLWSRGIIPDTIQKDYESQGIKFDKRQLLDDMQLIIYVALLLDSIQKSKIFMNKDKAFEKLSSIDLGEDISTVLNLVEHSIAAGENYIYDEGDYSGSKSIPYTPKKDAITGLASIKENPIKLKEYISFEGDKLQFFYKGGNVKPDMSVIITAISRSKTAKDIIDVARDTYVLNHTQKEMLEMDHLENAATEMAKEIGFKFDVKNPLTYCENKNYKKLLPGEYTVVNKLLANKENEFAKRYYTIKMYGKTHEGVPIETQILTKDSFINEINKASPECHELYAVKKLLTFAMMAWAKHLHPDLHAKCKKSIEEIERRTQGFYESYKEYLKKEGE